jgi:hypothetical protein
MPSPVTINAHYYQQFDADLSLEVPAEGYAGWKQAPLEFDFDHTALVVMHAWDCGTPERYPGWFRCVEYIPRAQEIARTVFPPLLSSARKAGLRVYHVVDRADRYAAFPGQQRASGLVTKPTQPPPVSTVQDPCMRKLRAFRSREVFVGEHNAADVAAGFKNTAFMPEATPVGEEGIAENADQLFALCEADRINHLVYVGFAINWCLLLSPGGMHDMSRRHIMCSAIRQAVTAVENKETARTESNKAEGLWRTALAFGFVFDDFEFIKALG